MSYSYKPVFGIEPEKYVVKKRFIKYISTNNIISVIELNKGDIVFLGNYISIQKTSGREFFLTKEEIIELLYTDERQLKIDKIKDILDNE